MSFTPADLVLITGGNGHVAQNVVDQLLARPSGPRVRATVRSASSASGLGTHFASHISSKRLEIALVPDLLAPNAFDKALDSVTHIAHIASPLILDVKDVENDLLRPAITGTTAILTAAVTSPTVRSVVVTGSFASVVDVSQHPRTGYTYTSADWNPITRQEVVDPNLDLTRWSERYQPFVRYMASKTLAEQAAWKLYEKEKPKWGLCVLLPSDIGGPYVLPLVKGKESLTWSCGVVWGIAEGGELPKVDWTDWTDVRDVAKAHVRALEREESRGKRIIIAGASLVYSDFADIVRQNFPELKPSTEKQEGPHHEVDTAKAAEALGITEWISMEKMVVDSVNQILQYERK